MKFKVEENYEFGEVVFKGILYEEEEIKVRLCDMTKEVSEMVKRDLEEYLTKKIRSEFGIDEELKSLLYEMMKSEDKYERLILFDRINKKLFKDKE